MRIGGSGFPVQFQGNFVAAGNTPERVRRQLDRATSGDTVRIMALKHVDNPIPVRVADGLVDGTKKRNFWIGQAVSGDTALEFLDEYFHIPQKLGHMGRTQVDRVVRRVMEGHLGKGFEQSTRLYDTLAGFARRKNSPDQDPMVDLFERAEQRRADRDSKTDPWASDDDGWRGGTKDGTFGEDWGLDLDGWKRGRRDDD